MPVRAAPFVVSLLVLLMTVDARPGDLRIDPLLIAQAHEVWSLIATDDNPVWPGWNAASTPLLVYLPNEQEVLINHPKPPSGFTAYQGPLSFPGFAMMVKDGPTSITLDGQNTSRTINGVPTLVVADTLSNRRNTVLSLIDDPRAPAAKAGDVSYATLTSDPYDQLMLVVHEAFHVHQGHKAPSKGANETLILDYPVLSVANNVGFALEGRALACALRASDEAGRRAAAREWLAVRLDRRRQLPAPAIEYEDGTEFNEGLAKYVEYRLSEVLEEREPDQALLWAQGFRGYEDLTFLRQRLIGAVERHLGGDVRVNNSLHDTGCARMRLYYSGMAIAALLDHLDATWTQRIFESGTTLTSLAREAIAADDAALAKVLGDLRASSAHQDLVRAKESFAKEGRSLVERALADITAGEATGLTLDYSALVNARVALGYTPFGVVRVDQDRIIYRQIPLTGSIGDAASFEQAVALPLLHDQKAHLVQFRLPRRMQEEEVAAATGGTRLPLAPISNATLRLPGVTIKLRHAELQWADNTLRVRLLPDSR